MGIAVWGREQRLTWMWDAGRGERGRLTWMQDAVRGERGRLQEQTSAVRQFVLALTTHLEVRSARVRDVDFGAACLARKGASVMVEGAIKHLPLTSAELFGRDAELKWLDACWREGVFVASIIAWGGVGKTSLVAKWLAGMRDDGWRGAERIYDWSFYRQGTNTAGSSDTFFADALAKCGDPDPTKGSPWDKGERLAKLVREKRTLLVLDGVEPMQYGPGPQEGQFKDPALQTLVKELASNNRGFLLRTSRLPLTDLNGLSGVKVQAKPLEHLSKEAGAALLRARGAKGIDADLEAASTEYRGHALALTLLGSFLEDVAKGDIRRRDVIGPLMHDERYGGHARRVMTSYELLLGKTELAVLRMLGLFDRPATEGELGALRAEPMVPGLTDALVGVGGRDWNRALAKLRRIGLIAADAAHGIDAHPLVREHFSEQLKGENIEAYREGHRRLYEFLRTSTKEFPETIAEMEPLYKAVVHGCLAGKYQEALIEVWQNRIMRRDEHFAVDKLGAFGLNLAMFASFFAPPWEQLADGLSQAAQACVWSHSGYALRALGRPAEGFACMGMGIAHDLELGNLQNAARGASNLSALLQSCGLLDDALKMARKCVELADWTMEPFERLGNRTTLAAVLHSFGRQDEAAAVYEEADKLRISEWVGDGLFHSIQGLRYCDLLVERGALSAVQQGTAASLIYAREHRGPLDNGFVHLSAGRAYLAGIRNDTACEVDKPRQHIGQAVELFRKATDQEHLPLGLLARAELYVYTREFANARRDLDEAMTIATRCGFRLHECDAHLGYARLAIAEVNATEAREHWEKARKIVEETGYHRRDGELVDIDNKVNRLPPPIPGPVTSSNTNTPMTTPNQSNPMSTSYVFPNRILDAYRDGKLAILFGSGLSLAHDVKGSFPSWDQLPNRLLDFVETQSVHPKERVEAKRKFINAKPRLPLELMLTELDTLKVALELKGEYRSALEHIFLPKDAAAGDVHKALVETGVNLLLTTNYDWLLESVDGARVYKSYTWQKADQALADVKRDNKVLFKIHGTASEADTVVITREEYHNAAEHESYQRTMTHLLQSHTFLLVGYGINDPLDLDLLFKLNVKAFKDASHRHFALMIDDSTNDAGRWLREMKVDVLPYADHADLPGILRSLAATKGSTNPP